MIIHIGPLEHSLYIEIYIWILENECAVLKNTDFGYYIKFDSKEDATLFRLRFGL